jgi:hypothetical protein
MPVDMAGELPVRTFVKMPEKISREDEPEKFL